MTYIDYKECVEEAYRCILYTNQPNRTKEFLTMYGQDASHVEEKEDVYKQIQDNINYITIEAPKKRKIGLSRYSDGSHPVVYFAREEAVAIAEKAMWIKGFLNNPNPSTKMEPTVIIAQATISGFQRSYMIKWRTMPYLVHPTDYKLCQDIAKEAIKDGVEMLEVPSARVLDGVNRPVIAAKCIKVNKHNIKKTKIKCEEEVIVCENEVTVKIQVVYESIKDME